MHHPTLAAFLAEGARRWPDRVWCRTPSGETTRAEAFGAARRVAGGLGERGVEKGDHIVVVLPNSLEFVFAWFGMALAGAVSVAMNPKAVEAELARVVTEIQPRLVLSTEGVELPPVDTLTVDVGDLLVGAPGDAAPASPDDPVSYIQSSGTTGRPKFVIETNRMYAMAAEGFPYWLGLTEDDVCLTTLPLSHLNAQAYSTLGSFGCGAELVLLPHFSVSGFWEQAAAYGATEFNAIGAMLEMLMAQPPSAAEREHRVRLAYSGPAPTGERHREMEARFGLRLLIGYALSESPYGLVVPLDEPFVPESMGRPRQHPTLGTINEARLVGADGADVGVGEVGELLLRNPATTPGYFNQPEESARVLRDGWLHTGDLARRDEAGHHFFCGRVKEIIRRRGENLSPAEVEAVLDAHPQVASSAVIGVPSDLSEEDVKAFVQPKPGAAPTAEELAEWCTGRLPPYKRPRYIEFVEDWPLTETQKIAKPRLPRERTDAEVDLSSDERTRA